MSSQKKVLLIVEDDPDVRGVFVDLGRDLGLQVLEAENGRQALDLIRSHHVDVVLSDVRMPVMDGMQLLSELRRIDPVRPPVILASGYAEYEEAEALSRGAVALLPKPFEVRRLSKLLGEVLASVVTEQE